MVEQIDVGGPAMVRAAAKNFRYTTVVVDEQDYRPVAEALARDGDIPLEQKQALAFKAFSYTSFYDALIAGFLGSEQALPAAYYTVAGRKVLQLRYGENPHQLAALYIRDRRSPFWQIAQLQGKELSFNNLLDLSMSYELLNDFQECPPLAVIVKHQNPCGAALAESQPQAFHNALAGDPQSAFGGIVGFNRVVEGATAQTMKDIFLEVVIAPGFAAEALEIFKKKKNLRLIQAPLGYRELHDVKTIPGGFVFQTRDQGNENSDSFALKTERPLTPSEQADVAFGWKLVKYVKSNAIIIVKQQQLLGVGAGQMSRVDAVELAIRKSRFPLAGAVLLSDAFFPFPDSIDLAAAQKISVIVEPGGSVKDGEVIATAAAHGLSLLFTSVRHFRH